MRGDAAPEPADPTQCPRPSVRMHMMRRGKAAQRRTRGRAWLHACAKNSESTRLVHSTYTAFGLSAFAISAWAHRLGSAATCATASTAVLPIGNKARRRVLAGTRPADVV